MTTPRSALVFALMTVGCGEPPVDPYTVCVEHQRQGIIDYPDDPMSCGCLHTNCRESDPEADLACQEGVCCDPSQPTGAVNACPRAGCPAGYVWTADGCCDPTSAGDPESCGCTDSCDKDYYGELCIADGATGVYACTCDPIEASDAQDDCGCSGVGCQDNQACVGGECVCQPSLADEDDDQCGCRLDCPADAYCLGGVCRCTDVTKVMCDLDDDAGAEEWACVSSDECSCDPSEHLNDANHCACNGPCAIGDACFPSPDLSTATCECDPYQHLTDSNDCGCGGPCPDGATCNGGVCDCTRLANAQACGCADAVHAGVPWLGTPAQGATCPDGAVCRSGDCECDRLTDDQTCGCAATTLGGRDWPGTAGQGAACNVGGGMHCEEGACACDPSTETDTNMCGCFPDRESLSCNEDPGFGELFGGYVCQSGECACDVYNLSNTTNCACDGPCDSDPATAAWMDYDGDFVFDVGQDALFVDLGLGDVKVCNNGACVCPGGEVICNPPYALTNNDADTCVLDWTRYQGVTRGVGIAHNVCTSDPYLSADCVTSCDDGPADLGGGSTEDRGGVIYCVGFDSDCD